MKVRTSKVKKTQSKINCFPCFILEEKEEIRLSWVFVSPVCAVYRTYYKLRHPRATLFAVNWRPTPAAIFTSTSRWRWCQPSRTTWPKEPSLLLDKKDLWCSALAATHFSACLPVSVQKSESRRYRKPYSIYSQNPSYVFLAMISCTQRRKTQQTRSKFYKVFNQNTREAKHIVSLSVGINDSKWPTWHSVAVSVGINDSPTWHCVSVGINDSGWPTWHVVTLSVGINVSNTHLYYYVESM